MSSVRRVISRPSSWKTGAGEFVSTHWDVVVTSAIKDGADDLAHVALTQLCRDYWPPLYIFARRRGYSRPDAQDLTQEFFARLLASRAHGCADRAKGKFRTFLLAMFKNFLANEWDKQQCLKRGGGYQFTSWQEIDAEERNLLGSADHLSPEKLFDRRWAQTLLERVLAILRNEYEVMGQAGRFELGKQWLVAGGDKPDYATAAAALGIEETGMRSIVHRLRRRFRELIRSEIAATVSESEQVDEEVSSLFEALKG